VSRQRKTGQTAENFSLLFNKNQSKTSIEAGRATAIKREKIWI
jgi:hypothetical protein